MTAQIGNLQGEAAGRVYVNQNMNQRVCGNDSVKQKVYANHMKNQRMFGNDMKQWEQEIRQRASLMKTNYNHDTFYPLTKCNDDVRNGTGFSFSL